MENVISTTFALKRHALTQVFAPKTVKRVTSTTRATKNQQLALSLHPVIWEAIVTSTTNAVIATLVL